MLIILHVGGRITGDIKMNGELLLRLGINQVKDADVSPLSVLPRML